MTDNQILKVAEWCVDVGRHNTTEGNYIIDYEDIAAKFDVSVQEIHEDRFKIRDEIDSYECILSQTWLEEETGERAFNMNFCKED